MFDPSAMILADRANRQHVRSARPEAPTAPETEPRRRGDAAGRHTVATLRRLADRLEPRRIGTSAPVSS